MTMRELQRLGQEFDAADAAALSEREAIVKWLRAQATCGCNSKHGWCNEDGPPLAYAKAIERGDHLK